MAGKGESSRAIAGAGGGGTFAVGLDRGVGTQHQHRAGPIGMVEINAVAAGADDQKQLLRTAKIGRNKLRLVAAAADAAVGQLLAVGPNLKAARTLAVRIVIDADQGGELKCCAFRSIRI